MSYFLAFFKVWFLYIFNIELKCFLKVFWFFSFSCVLRSSTTQNKSRSWNISNQFTFPIETQTVFFCYCTYLCTIQIPFLEYIFNDFFFALLNNNKHSLLTF